MRSLSEILALPSTQVQCNRQREQQHGSTGSQVPHLTSSSLLPNMQILVLPFSFSDLNLLRNAPSTPGSLQALSQAAWLLEQ